MSDTRYPIVFRKGLKVPGTSFYCSIRLTPDPVRMPSSLKAKDREFLGFGILITQVWGAGK